MIKKELVFLVILLISPVLLRAQDNLDEFTMDLFADSAENEAIQPEDDESMEMSLFDDSEEMGMDLLDDSDDTMDLFAEEDSQNIFAEEDLSGDDSLSLFDNADSITPSEPSWVDLFVENINGETVGRYDWFFYLMDVEENASPEPDNKRHLFDLATTLSTYTGANNWRLTASITSNMGNRDNTYIPSFEDLEARDWRDWLQDTEREKRYLNLNDLYISLFFPDFDVFFGKKQMENTLSTLYSPADVYTPKDENSPFYSTKFGKIMAEIDYYIGNVNLTAAVFPVYQGGKNFSAISRWGYYKAKEIQDEEGIDLEEEEESEDEDRNYTDISWENISYLLKLKSSFSGIDLFVTTFYGLADNNVSMVFINDEDEEEKKSVVVPVFNASAGFSTTIKKLELHGEALYNYSLDSKDDDYLDYVVGGRYIFDEFSEVPFLDKIEFILEYGGEWLIKEQSHEDYEDSTTSLGGIKNDLLGTIKVDFTPDWQLTLFGQYELDDKGGIFMGKLNYTGFVNLDLELAGKYFLTPEESNYYYWRHSHGLTASATYSF